MYIESEFMLLQAQNEQLARENKRLAEALAWVNTALALMSEDWYIEGIRYQIKQALMPAEECTCLPELPDGRVNGGRGGCCPVCEAEYDPDAPIPIGGE